MDKAEKDFIRKFLTNEQIEKNLYSNLVTALNDVRKISGRDNNGNIDNYFLTNEKSELINPNSLIVFITYFTILDLLGSIFKLKNFSLNSKNNIRNILEQFSALKNEEIKLLVILRNGLTHNFSLVSNYTRKNKPEEFYHFILDHSQSNEIVKVQNSWNGKKSDKTDNNSVIVHTVSFINLIEELYRKIIKEFDLDNMELRETIEKIKSKYTIRE